MLKDTAEAEGSAAQKAWGAACHADWISKQLDEAMARYQQLGDEHRGLLAEIDTLKTALEVRNEITYEIDSAKIEQRLAFPRENYRVMREKLLEIVNWTAASAMPRPIARDRVEAAKAVVMMDLAVLNAEMAAGLYK